MSTKAVQESIVENMRRWQKIENASVSIAGQVIEETENPIVRLIMEIIRLLYREGYTLDGAEKQMRATPKGAQSEEVSTDQGLADIKRGLEDILSLVS